MGERKGGRKGFDQDKRRIKKKERKIIIKHKISMFQKKTKP